MMVPPWVTAAARRSPRFSASSSSSSSPRRARRAAAVAAELHRAYLANCVGAVYLVLFEQAKGDRYAGHAPNYMEVLVEGESLHNQIRNVKITGSNGQSLLGELVED